MRPAFAFLFRSVAFAAIAAPLVPLGAQNASNTAVTSQPATTNDGKKVLNLDDYGRWRRISGTAISNDGKWMHYTLTPNEGGETTLHITPLDGGSEVVIPVGGGGGGGRGGRGGRGGGGGEGSATTFSGDSKWIVYFVTPPSGRGGRGATGGGRGAATPATATATPPSGHLELRNLSTGDVDTLATSGTWRFSPDSKYLVIKTAVAASAAAGGGRGAGAADTAGQDRVTGSNLILRDLATGVDRVVGNVAEYEFNDSGKLLAYTVDVAERLGNGVYLLDPATGEQRILNAASQDYSGLVWGEEGSNLAVLRGDKSKTMKQRDNVLLAWTGLDAKGGGRAFTLDPAKWTGFPKGFVVSEYNAPRWSKDASKLFIAIKAQEPEVAAADSNKANVDVWHWKDVQPQSVQIVQVQQARRATLPGVVLLPAGTFVQLGDDSMRTVTIAANNDIGIGRHDAAYRGEVTWGGSRADIYKVEVATGARTLIDKAVGRVYGTSPDSKWFLYLKIKQVRAVNLQNGAMATLDASGTPTKTFINEDDDHAYEIPLWGVAGWSKDGKHVLLYDKYDVWQVPLDGTRATNLTQGIGRAQQIQFRVTRFGAAGGGRGGGGGGRGGGAAAGEDDGIDLSRTITLSAYGDRTKKSGYWRVTAGQAPKQVVWADKNIGGIIKADSANRMLYTEQDFDQYPDYWVTDTNFAAPKKVTDANPILTEYAWSAGRVLIDYTDSKGHKLQGTLMLPAGYEKGKRYPMLVEFYELRSQNHNNFSQPGYSNSPQLSTYASNGYLVFEPDVVYEIGKPGTSSVDCITAAVRRVIELGYADPARIGLHGHSWSGYQSSFIVTQTDMFAAVVTGAPPTNLISFYNELYKRSGNVQQGITTVGQVRMGAGVTPWNNTKLFMEQSPIFYVDNIKTPFMILHGMEDDAVDYIEGLQFFNAARRAGKEVTMLAYPGQPHNLTDRDAQKDFTIRMKQYFDHYLMDKAMPEWMKNGLPQVGKGGPIR